MPTTVTQTGGNPKLRGLLRTSRELLRRRQFKRALNNAHIARDFALRAQEDPGVAAAARLLTAEIYLLNAAYAGDEEMRLQGWRTLEQLEADGLQGGEEAVDPHELAYVKAVSLRRLGDFAAAEENFREAIAATPSDHVALARMEVGYLAALVQGETLDSDHIDAVMTEARSRISHGDADEREGLIAQVALACAYRAMRAGNLNDAYEGAHRAKQLARRAEEIEVEALADFFLGELSRLRGNAAIALRFLYESLDAAERTGYAHLHLRAQLAIAQVYDQLDMAHEAARYFASVAAVARERGRPEFLIPAALALGNVAADAGEFGAANGHYAAALGAARERDRVRDQGLALSYLGRLKLREGETGFAEHLLAEARRVYEGVGLAGQDVPATLLLAEGRLRLAQGRPDEVLDALQDLADATSTRGQLAVEAHELTSELLAAAGRDAEALPYALAAAREARSLVEAQRTRHLPDLDMRAALRKKERQIEKLTAEADLKDALFAKNEQIERANRDLLQANEELRQFAYVASHDLKEPLRQIGSYVSLIRRNYGELLDERGEGFFAFVTEGVGRLNRLLDALMHYTAVARLEVSEERVDLAAVAEELRRGHAAQLRALGGTLRFEGEPALQTSGELLRHVLAALVDNAVKFHRPGVAPEVALVATRHGEDVRLVVRDNGVGIPAEYAEKVFGLFQMLREKSGALGTGVGLAIAQKTVQRLGGRIHFEANPDGAEGTSFVVELPGAAAESVSAEVAPEQVRRDARLAA